MTRVPDQATSSPHIVDSRVEVVRDAQQDESRLYQAKYQDIGAVNISEQIW